MNVTEMTRDDYYRYCKNQIDDYLGSIKGLYAFASIACWSVKENRVREESSFTIPRRMTITEKGRDKNLTPDCVVQVRGGYGIVAEMKKHYRDDDVSALEQIQKYDKDLIGWWSEDEKIADHDLVLLCHYFSSTAARDAYRVWKEKDNSYDRNFAIVEFSYSETGHQWFVLKRIEGNLSDASLDESLRKIRKIPDQVLIDIVSQYKFYDARPPLILLLVLIHGYILPSMAGEDEYEIDSSRRYPVVRVTARAARNKLEQQFCPRQDKRRQPQIPKTKWVKEALEALVRMKLAKAEAGKNDVVYRIPLKKPPKKDVVVYFSGKLYDLQTKPRISGKAPEQMEMF